jgi:hypothetical protein
MMRISEDAASIPERQPCAGPQRAACMIKNKKTGVE